MAAKLTRKQIILAKIESVYGTDPTPTGGANAIQITGTPTIKPLSSTLVPLNRIKGYLGSSPTVLADTHVELDFEVEASGAGAAGTAPAYGPLLRACGLSETINSGVSVVYQPISASFESVTLYYFLDGILHKITGARGTMQMTFDVKKVPTMKFTFTGLYNAPTDTALPAANYSSFLVPVVVSNTNTTAFSFNGFSGNMTSLSLNMGNKVDYRTNVGTSYVMLTDREAKGSTDFEAPAIGTQDFFDQALNDQTLGSLALQHGQVAGNIVALASSGIDLEDPSYKDDSGIMMITAPFNYVPSTAGNDEFTITVM